MTFPLQDWLESLARYGYAPSGGRIDHLLDRVIFNQLNDTVERRLFGGAMKDLQSSANRCVELWTRLLTAESLTLADVLSRPVLEIRQFEPDEIREFRRFLGLLDTGGAAIESGLLMFTAQHLPLYDRRMAPPRDRKLYPAVMLHDVITGIYGRTQNPFFRAIVEVISGRDSWRNLQTYVAEQKIESGFGRDLPWPTSEQAARMSTLLERVIPAWTLAAERVRVFPQKKAFKQAAKWPKHAKIVLNCLGKEGGWLWLFLNYLVAVKQRAAAMVADQNTSWVADLAVYELAHALCAEDDAETSCIFNPDRRRSGPPTIRQHLSRGRRRCLANVTVSNFCPHRLSLPDLRSVAESLRGVGRS